MRRLVLILLAVVAVLGALAAVAVAADPPAAKTGAAKDVGETQATLTATVDPKGSATQVHFELGTTTGYGLQSAGQDAGSGTGPVAISIPVQGLTAGTTYHARVVATSAAGTTRGDDVTFTTAKAPVAPTAPAVSTSGLRDRTTSAITITGTVNPHGAATTYRVDYGPSTALGTSTAPVDAGAGTSPVGVAVRLEGLQAAKTYHYRIVAINAKGTTRGADHTFTVLSTPTSTTLDADADPTTYGRPVTVRGKLAGSKVSGVKVRLQATAFPFSSPFADTGATATSDKTGAFSFTLPALTLTTRVVAIADGLPPVLSPVRVLRSAARAGITSVHRTADRHVVVSGRVIPATAQGIAALQRRSANGAWLPLRRAHLDADGRYAISVRWRPAAMVVRVVGLPHDGGGHVRGTSRAVTLAGRR